MITHYERLKIEPKIEGEDETDFRARVKKAFNAMIRYNHPDRGGDADTAAKIYEARDVLSDPTQRSLYDQELPLMRELELSNRRAFDLASGFDNCFNWVSCICQTVQAIRKHTRSIITFRASDQKIADILQYANERDSHGLQDALYNFVKSDTHWNTTSARTLFFDLLIMRRCFADPEKRQEEALRYTMALCNQHFDQPPADITTTADDDSIEQMLNQGARNILALQTQIDFICQHLNADQQRDCELLDGLLDNYSTAVKLQSDQTDEHRRFFAAIAAVGSSNQGAIALILTIEQVTLKRLASPPDEQRVTTAILDNYYAELKTQLPDCTLFARQAASDHADGEANVTTTHRAAHF